jgi:arsenate reductase
MARKTTSRSKPDVTIFHNPSCGTSRKVLQTIRDAGYKPKVVEYLKAGWRREQLDSLLERMGLKARDILRVRGTQAQELGLTAAGTTDAAILAAMVADPSLVERPIVIGPRGVVLCRPPEQVSTVL